MRHITLALTAAAALTACSPDRWTGFVYPDKTHLAKHETIGDFESLDACRDAARARLGASYPERSDYECGWNCKPLEGVAGMQVCKTTER